jgi:hypothetical protein
VAENLYSDDPITSLEADRLGRREYVRYVARVLERVRDRGTSSTVIGVIGPWGSGKSSIAGLVVDELPKDWRRAKFEPWGYSDLDSMVFGFFEELRSALPKGKKWSQKRKLIGGVGRALSPVGAAGGVLGMDASGLLSGVSDLIAGDASPSAVLSAASDAMSDLKKPVLVTVDDLDRLSPDELLMVFKLVRFLGRLPNVYYLLCYDEQTLIELLKRTDLASDSARRAQDYLEKMIQVRLDLPPIREQDAENLLNENLNDVFAAHQIVLTRAADDRLGEAYRSVLRRRLTTPRAIRRFTTQLDAFISALESDVDACDFVILTWIRTFEPRLYEVIHTSRAELTNGISFDHLSESLPEAKVRWEARLKDLGFEESLVEPFGSLLGTMFIPIRAAWSNSQYGSDFYDELAEGSRIGHKDYFDRYFAFSILNDDISDAEVESALNAEGADTARLTRLMRDDPPKVARKLSSAMANDRVDPATVVRYIVAESGQSAERLASEGPGPMSWVVREALVLASSEVGPSLITEVCTDLTGIGIIADAVSREKMKQENNRLTADEQWHWMGSGIEGLNVAIEAWLGDPQESLRDGASAIFGPWRWIAPSSCKAWLGAHVGAHEIVGVVSSLMYVRQTEDGRWVGPLTAETLDAYIGLDIIAAQIPPSLDLTSARALDPANWDQDDWQEDTPAAREELALASLRRALPQSVR